MKRRVYPYFEKTDTTDQNIPKTIAEQLKLNEKVVKKMAKQWVIEQSPETPRLSQLAGGKIPPPAFIGDDMINQVNKELQWRDLEIKRLKQKNVG